MIQRRRYQRVPFFCSVGLQCMPEGATLTARSFDISVGGVGLTTGQTLVSGQIVSLTFHLKDRKGQKREDQLVGRVAYVRAELDGNVVGVEFLEPLTSSKNPELLRQALQA